MFFEQINNDFAYRQHHILYHQGKNLVLFLTPKAGNSSIKKAILNGMGYDLHYEYPAGFEFITPTNVGYLREHRHSYCIAFVRNPFNRFVSAWKDKINDDRLDAGIGHPFDPCGTKMPMSEFLQHAENTQWAYQNMHYRSMAWETQFNGTYLVDEFFRLEELVDGSTWDRFRETMKEFGIDPYPLDLVNPSPRPSLEMDIDPRELKHRIEARYIYDYIRFGYVIEELCLQQSDLEISVRGTDVSRQEQI